MNARLCPACDSVSPRLALFCPACGTALDELDTLRMPMMGLDKAEGALWLPEPRASKQPFMPAEEPVEEPDPIGDLSFTLREVASPTSGPEWPDTMAAARRPSPDAEQTVADDQAPRHVPEPPAELLRDEHPPPLAAPDHTESKAKKVARRAAVRRDRLDNTVQQSSNLTDMMVLDPDDSSRRQLQSLLDAFGFDVQWAGDITSAEGLLSAQPFSALFLDVPLDAQGVGLCHLARKTASLHATPAPLLVLLVKGLNPTLRVLSELAGFDEALLKPVTRNAVARVLDTHNIALPLDPRRV